MWMSESTPAPAASSAVEPLHSAKPMGYRQGTHVTYCLRSMARRDESPALLGDFDHHSVRESTDYAAAHRKMTLQEQLPKVVSDTMASALATRSKRRWLFLG